MSLRAVSVPAACDPKMYAASTPGSPSTAFAMSPSMPIVFCTRARISPRRGDRSLTEYTSDRPMVLVCRTPRRASCASSAPTVGAEASTRRAISRTWAVVPGLAKNSCRIRSRTRDRPNSDM